MCAYTSVVMTKALALGFIVTSPVIRPTSWNSSYNSRYFWLLRALKNITKQTIMTKCSITCGQYNLLLSEMQKKFGDRVLTMKLCCNHKQFSSFPKVTKSQELSTPNFEMWKPLKRDQTTHCHQKQSQLPMTMKQF